MAQDTGGAICLGVGQMNVKVRGLKLVSEGGKTGVRHGTPVLPPHVVMVRHGAFMCPSWPSNQGINPFFWRTNKLVSRSILHTHCKAHIGSQKYETGNHKYGTGSHKYGTGAINTGREQFVAQSLLRKVLRTICCSKFAATNWLRKVHCAELVVQRCVA